MQDKKLDHLKEREFPLPERTICCPLGLYAAAKVELREGGELSREQPVPLHRFIRENGYRADSETTAFLYRIDYSAGEPGFIYRLRVKVAERES